jgi:hypothetical protein
MAGLKGTYWGTAQDFAIELRSFWKKYREEQKGSRSLDSKSFLRPYHFEDSRE